MKKLFYRLIMTIVHCGFAFIIMATLFNIDMKLAAVLALPVGVLCSVIDRFEEKKRGL